MNAFASISATTETSASTLLHANTIRWLQEIPEFLTHAVEALHEAGEEDGAKGMVKRAIRDLTRILEKIDEPTPVYVQPEPDPLYLSAGLPDGYDTHLGFLTKRNPDVFFGLSEPVEDLLPEHAELRRLTRQAGLDPVRVPPCIAVAATGRTTDWAYPVSVLERYTKLDD